jgi:hypothetical protein
MDRGGRREPLAALKRSPKESGMSDLLYVAITVVVFALLVFLVRGLEHLER